MRFSAPCKNFLVRIVSVYVRVLRTEDFSIMAKHTQLVAGSKHGMRIYSMHGEYCQASASHLKCDCKKSVSYTLDGRRMRQSLNVRSYVEALKLAEQLEKKLCGMAEVTPEKIKVSEAVQLW